MNFLLWLVSPHGLEPLKSLGVSGVEIVKLDVSIYYRFHLDQMILDISEVGKTTRMSQVADRSDRWFG